MLPLDAGTVFGLSGSPNAAGIAELLVAQTGVPGDLRFCARDEVDWSPWEQPSSLARGQADLVLVLGGKVDAHLAVDCACVVQIGPQSPGNPEWKWCPSARTGIETPGTFVRLDGLPVYIRPVTAAELPALVALLADLRRFLP